MQFVLIWPLIQLRRRRTLLALGPKLFHSTSRRWVWISWAAVRLWKEIIFCFEKKMKCTNTKGRSAHIWKASQNMKQRTSLLEEKYFVCHPRKEGTAVSYSLPPEASGSIIWFSPMARFCIWQTLLRCKPEAEPTGGGGTERCCVFYPG